MDLSWFIAESLLRTRSEAIIAVDRDGTIRFWNPAQNAFSAMPLPRRSVSLST